MKKISLLGSTGSIGKSTLEVAEHLDLEVVALAANSSVDLMEAQARRWNPSIVALYDEKSARELKKRLPHLKVVSGMEGLIEAASYPSASITVSAMMGTLGLLPTLAAIRAGKDIALANKETLVSGGTLVTNEAKKYGIRLLPVDSEHGALFQCLVGENYDAISRLILTASGGAFRSRTKETLFHATAEEALRHPTWMMGPKITVDCSTLMNKGLEMIEAHHLFNIPAGQIDVVIHPQSIIHSMVEFKDGSMKAQMSLPDMKLPIQYALTYPERKQGVLKPFDFIHHGKLEFLQVDRLSFRCLDLAYESLKSGGTMPGYMNAANEILVGKFLQGKIVWGEIAAKLETLMNRHSPQPLESIDVVLEVDRLARLEAAEI